MRATLHKLVTAKGYPAAIQGLAYDPMLAVRGLVVDRVNGNIFKPDRYGFPGRARHGLSTIDRSHDRRALPARAHAAVEPALRLDRLAVRAARGGALRLPGRLLRSPRRRPRSPTTRRCGSTSASASTSRTATDRSRRSSARSCCDFVERDEGAGGHAAQVPIVGEAAVSAHQLGVGLHLGGDELPARRRARRLPVVAQLLRRHRGQRRQARVLHRRASVRRAGRATASRSPRRRRTGRSSAGESIRAATSRSSRRGPTRTATACCSSAITSTATCCAAGSRRTGAPRWCCRSSSTRSRCTTGCAPSCRGSTDWTPS